MSSSSLISERVLPFVDLVVAVLKVSSCKKLKIDVSFERKQIRFRFKKHFYQKKIPTNVTTHFFPSFLSIKNFVPATRVPTSRRLQLSSDAMNTCERYLSI